MLWGGVGLLTSSCLATEPELIPKRSSFWQSSQSCSHNLTGWKTAGLSCSSRQCIEYLYMLFPDEGHGFAKPENRLRFYAAAEKFLAKHLGGRYEETIQDSVQ